MATASDIARGVIERQKASKRLQTKFLTDRAFIEAKRKLLLEAIPILTTICLSGSPQDFRDFLLVYSLILPISFVLRTIILQNRYDLAVILLPTLHRSVLLDPIQSPLLGEENLHPIHLAARNSNPQFVELLLNHGATLTVDRRSTPLMEAITHGVKATFALILSRSFQKDLEARSHNEQTVLHLAVGKDSIFMVESLLRSEHAPEDLLNIPDRDGETPFHYAARFGYTDMLITLYRFGYREHSPLAFQLAFYSINPIETASVLIALGIPIPSNLGEVLRIARLKRLRISATELRKRLQISESKCLEIRFLAYFHLPLTMRLLDALNTMDRFQPPQHRLE